MTGVWKLCYYNSTIDKRQQSIFFKKIIIKNNLNEIIYTKNWKSYYFLELFLLNTQSSHLFCYSTTINSADTLLVTNISKKKYLEYSLLLLTNLTSIYFFIDATFYKTLNVKHLFLGNFYNYLSYIKYSFIVEILKNSNCITLYSISTIYKGSSWVERELREFFQLYFVGLNDTRRLLTDYLEDNFYSETYKTTSYNLILQELYN